MEKYHGKKIGNDSGFDEIMPSNLSASGTPDGVYHRVRFTGNFGAFCSEYQEFERYNITHKEAKQIEWSSFGMCGHTVSVFDRKGNLIDDWS